MGIRITSQWISVVVVGAALLTALGLFLGIAEIIPVVTANGKRISSQEVTLLNVKSFEAQLFNEIPTGTSLTELESYLERGRIRHVLWIQDRQAKNNYVHAVIEGLCGWISAFPRLSIYFEIDSGMVTSIRFRIEYF